MGASGSKIRLSETVRPVLTRDVAARRFWAVIRFTAPISSSSPHRPQLRRVVYHSSTSAWVGNRGSDACAVVVRGVAALKPSNERSVQPPARLPRAAPPMASVLFRNCRRDADMVHPFCSSSHQRSALWCCPRDPLYEAKHRASSQTRGDHGIMVRTA